MQSSKENIFGYIKNSLKINPEFLWMKYPNYAVFRAKENKKWFAVFMDVKGEKLGLQTTNKIDILVIKLEPMLVDLFVGEKGILPAYHLNKSNWLTINLSENISFERIKGLIDLSYEITKNNEKSKKQVKNEQKTQKNG